MSLATSPTTLSHGSAWLVRLVVALFALSHAWSVFANLMSASHDGENWGEPFVEMHSEQHGHGHDHHDSSGDSDFGHQHGHNPADHSHDKSGLSHYVLSASIARAESWLAAEPARRCDGPYFSLERPPRPVSEL